MKKGKVFYIIKNLKKKYKKKKCVMIKMTQNIKIYKYGNKIGEYKITDKDYNYLIKDSKTKKPSQIKLTPTIIEKSIQFLKKESDNLKQELKNNDLGEKNLNDEEFKTLMQSYRYSKTFQERLLELQETMEDTDWFLIKFLDEKISLEHEILEI